MQRLLLVLVCLLAMAGVAGCSGELINPAPLPVVDASCDEAGLMGNGGVRVTSGSCRVRLRDGRSYVCPINAEPMSRTFERVFAAKIHDGRCQPVRTGRAGRASGRAD